MQLHLEQEINAPADAVWGVLGGEFADIASWASVVKASRPIDVGEVPASITVASTAPVPGRETTTKATLREILTAYSDEERSLTFEGAGLPKIVRLARNVQSVQETGPSTCKVVFDVQFDFAGPFGFLASPMKRRMTKTFGDVQTDLKLHVENGG